LYDCEFFCLTDFEAAFVKSIGIAPWKVNILPNGVDIKAFHFVNSVEKIKTLCLGKIDNRKRQPELQKMNLGVEFIGSIASDDFDGEDPDYKGIWSTEDVRSNLTYYTNLILLSGSELQPLVCLEALASGLGLVISEACTQSLDLDKPFITVIPDDKLNDKKYVEAAIKGNAEVSSKSRVEIREYAKLFDWNNIAKNYLSLINV
jgi:glycosyltransferase involved in cell wall biosynthesis